jgi:YcxB-like protein
MTERREISFLLTVEDHVAFHLFGQRRLPFWQRHLGQILLVYGLLIGVFAIFLFTSGRETKDAADPSPLTPTTGGFVIFFVLAAALALWMHPANFRRRLRALVVKPQNRHLLGEKTLLIGPQGISSKDQDIQTLIRWDMIEDIEETDAHVFFFVGQRTALILPCRAFPTDQDFEDFLNLARQYYEGIESERPPQPESIRAQPTRDEAFAPGARRESEPPTVLRVHDEPDGVCRNLSFVLTVEDHIAFHNLIYQRLPFWRRHLTFSLMVPLLLAAIFMSFLNKYNTQGPPRKILLIYGIGLGTMVVVVTVLWVFLMRRQAARRARQVRKMLEHPQNQKFVSEVTITIAPEEIISQSMSGTSALRWERIHEIVVTAEHAFFFHADQRAIVVPKRPLQAEEFDEFVELARQYHEGSLPCE